MMLVSGLAYSVPFRLIGMINLKANIFVHR
jgi:hypothetical protein